MEKGFWLSTETFFQLFTLSPFLVPKGEDNSHINLLREINGKFIPDLDYLTVDERLKEISEFFENLKGKEKTTYYLCGNYTCQPPLTDMEEVKKLLFE